MAETGHRGNWTRQVIAWRILLVLIVLLGLGLRVDRAWMGRFSPNSDYTISALTAKHMAEGRDYPVFFYGAPYCGNIEPYLTVAICRLFHLEVTGFMTHLGAALVGTLLLPLLYLFGLAAGGRRAGLIAMLYGLVGSDTNFLFTWAARHSVTTMQVGGFFAVWMACWIATRLRKNEPVSWGAYWAMGLAAGLGWWATQLVVFFLATAVVILLCGFRWSMFRQGLIPGAAGFLLGSLPWWWWNITHSWGSFEFAGFLGRVPLKEGLQSYWVQVLRLAELSPLSTWWNTARLVLFIGMLALFVALLIRAARRAEDRDSFYYRLAVPAMLIVSALIYATSKNARFNVPKYVLPVFPLLAVMIGVSTDWLLRRFRVPIGWLVFIVLVPPCLYSVVGEGRRALQRDRPKWEMAVKMADEIRPLCDGVCVGQWPLHWMNFASGERLCVAALPSERYGPYARRAELAERPGFLGNHRKIQEFLKGTGGHSMRTNVTGIAVDYGVTPPPVLDYDLTPPRDDWRYVDTTNVVSVRDSEGNSWRDVLQDGVIDTCWVAVVQPTNYPKLTFAFDRKVPVCGIRILSSSDLYPSRLMVEGGAGDDGPWETMLPMTGMTDYFWSGRYAKLGGLQTYQEVRFAAPTGGVTRLRLTCGGGAGSYRAYAGEVLLMEQAALPGGEYPSVESCLAALRLKGVKQFYGPRWLAERVAMASAGDGMETLVPSSMRQSIQDVPGGDSACPHPVTIRGNTGFLMDARDAARSRRILGGAGLGCEQIALGRCVLLVVPKPGGDADAARYPTLYWTEQGCFAADMGRFARQRTRAFHEKAGQYQAAGDCAGMVEMLQKTLAINPSHQAARKALVDALVAQGLKAEAATNAAILKEQTMPAVAARIRFPPGIEFLGLTLSASEAGPGDTVEIRYFWRCPSASESKRPRVFVHFLDGKKIAFQDDHDLLAETPVEDIREQTPDEIFAERRLVTIPASASPGEYRITFGLFYPKNGNRVRPITDLSEKNREVVLPVVLNIRHRRAASQSGE